MKRLLLINMLILLAVSLSLQCYAQVTCGGPCGGFTSTGASMNVGGTLTFTTSYTSGVTWSASSGLAIVSSTAGSITIQGVSAGTRTLCLAYNANGTVCSVCKVITVNDDCPPSNITVAFMYDPYANPPVVKATASVSGPYSYTWYVDGVDVTSPGTGFNQIAMPPSCQQEFNVYVKVTSASGCVRISECKKFRLDCFDNWIIDGIDDDPYNNVIVNLGPCTGGGGPIEEMVSFNPKGANIYPNPASGSVNLVFQDASTRTLELIDHNGTVVRSVTVSGKTYTFDVTGLNKGQYFIRQRSGKDGKDLLVERLVLE